VAALAVSAGEVLAEVAPAAVGRGSNEEALWYWKNRSMNL